jgi:hypothetical protein
VQPSIFDAALEDFLVTKWTTGSALSLGEQLYTARGSQSVGIGHYITEAT